MSAAKTPWLDMLQRLKTELKGKDHRGTRGSLRWLESLVAERGGRAGTVRNILYKDLGSVEEKSRLMDLFTELYLGAGLESPEPPGSLVDARNKRVLGRDKRLIYARFMRELERGAAPRYIVVGGPATGKGVLLEHLRRGLKDSVFVNLADDLAPAFFPLVEALDISKDYERLLAQLSPAQPYALQAARQRELLDLLGAALRGVRTPLLIRAEQTASLGGLKLRDADSHEVTLSGWLEPLLQALQTPYVAALSSPPAQLDYTSLRSPSRKEARDYLRQRLPDASRSTLDALLNKAGRNFGELSRLALMEMSRAGEGGEERLRGDAGLKEVLEVIAVLSPAADPNFPIALFEKLYETSLKSLSQAERALLESAGDDALRPALRTLLNEDVKRPELHAQALEWYRNSGDLFRTLFHARGAEAHDLLNRLLAQDPSRLALLPELWSQTVGWPPEAREALATAVVRYRAVLGDYRHPEAQEALDLLRASKDAARSAWARVKMAEAAIDEGRYADAEHFVDDLPALDEHEKAELFLVRAALARWQGSYGEAEKAVSQALALPIPPFLEDRAYLWQGLVAKDAGRSDEALSLLRRVGHTPVLVGRARYQEGDLLMRLGRAAEGAACIENALTLLGDSPNEERARIRARLGTVLRRLGRYGEAARHLYSALADAREPLTEARVRSEASILESARGRPWEALQLAGEAELSLRSMPSRAEEARYRHRRTLYRLAVAYWVWEVGDPYRAPFRGGRAAPKADALLTPLLHEIGDLVPESDRYTSLYLDTALMLALFSDPAESLEMLEPLLGLGNTYLRRQAQLAYTEVLLRRGRLEAAAARLESAETLLPDPSLDVWNAAISAEVQLKTGRANEAQETIDRARMAPVAFTTQLGRVWGRVLLESGQAKLSSKWLNRPGPMALPEALALTFAKDALRKNGELESSDPS